MTGRPPTVSDSDVLRVFADGADPVYSTTEVGDTLDIGQSGAFKRLDELRDSGFVDTKKIGPSRCWWITDKGRAYLRDSAGG